MMQNAFILTLRVPIVTWPKRLGIEKTLPWVARGAVVGLFFCFVLSETGPLYGIAGAGSLLSRSSVLLQAGTPWMVLPLENLSYQPECEIFL